jgi:hypothetical protein
MFLGRVNLLKIFSSKVGWRHKPAYLWYLITKPAGPVNTLSVYDAERFGIVQPATNGKPDRGKRWNKKPKGILDAPPLELSLGGSLSDQMAVTQATVPFKDRSFWQLYSKHDAAVNTDSHGIGQV